MLWWRNLHSMLNPNVHVEQTKSFSSFDWLAFVFLSFTYLHHLQRHKANIAWDIQVLVSNIPKLDPILGMPRPLVSSICTVVSLWCHSMLCKTYEKNLPLSSLSGSATNLAITFPGCSGLSKMPFSLASTKESYCALFMDDWPSDLSTPCISVSTRPGAMATLVMSGSSSAMWAETEL